ncbi:signal transduction histidine kinase [Spirosoma lacussanchae]|uniref:PAS domain-containing sensor histidine kinase n=1 Tax=Spirosoma lacussanchae TaxID=1884249 RepID=UPI0014872E75|nr:ATP-binding protein [Spirosoma lacussanchae]
MNEVDRDICHFVSNYDNPESLGAALFEPVRISSSIIPDFCCTAANLKFSNLVGWDYTNPPNLLTAHFVPIDEADKLLEALKYVFFHQKELDYSISTVHLKSAKSHICDCRMSPLGQGVLVSISTINPKHPEGTDTVSQVEVLENAFEACLNGITVYKAVLDDSQEPIDFKFEAINEVGLAMSGLSREQVIGKTLRELYPPTDSFGLFSIYKQVYTTREPYKGEHFYPDHGIWRKLVITYIERGIMVTYHDITPFKQLQQQHEQLIDYLVTSLPGGLVLLEPIMSDGQLVNLRIVRCNLAYAKPKDKDPDQLKGQLMDDVHPQWRSTQLMACVQQALLGDQACQGYETQRINGRLTEVDFQLIQVEGLLLITYRDLNNYHSEQHIQRLVSDLDRMSANLQEFAFVASHDLQEPLRKIQQFGGLLAAQYGDQLGAGREFLDRMQGSAGRLSSLLKELLDYSRLTTRLKEFKLVSLTELVTRVLNRFAIEIRESEARVYVDSLPIVMGDEIQLELLFEHLISNSIKFAASGTSPNIHIRSVTDYEEQLPAWLDIKGSRTEFICIKVVDEGIGFEQQHAERVFGVFQRLHGKSQYLGVGMGLAICRRVVENHKGAIVAQSDKGAGATFTIFLPSAG